MIHVPGSRTDEIAFRETLSLVNGEEIYLVSIPGMPVGVSVLKADIDSGAIRMQQAYDQMAQMWLDAQG